jgi:hypothetical protein
MLIAEYNKLREEQFGRTTVQQGLLALNLTGGAAFIAFAASTLDSQENQFMLAIVLLLLPILSSALALAYCEQHYSIMKVGLYLASDLERRARKMASPDAFLWHTFIIKYAKGGVDNRLGRSWRKTFAVYMPACFFSPSAAAVALAILVLFQRWQDLDAVEVGFVSALAALALGSVAFVIWLWMSSTKRIDALQSNAISETVESKVQGSVEKSVGKLTANSAGSDSASAD